MQFSYFAVTVLLIIVRDKILFLQLWRTKVITCYQVHCSAAKNLSLNLETKTLCDYKKKISLVIFNWLTNKSSVWIFFPNKTKAIASVPYSPVIALCLA